MTVDHEPPEDGTRTADGGGAFRSPFHAKALAKLVAGSSEAARCARHFLLRLARRSPGQMSCCAGTRAVCAVRGQRGAAQKSLQRVKRVLGVALEQRRGASPNAERAERALLGSAPPSRDERRCRNNANASRCCCGQPGSRLRRVFARLLPGLLEVCDGCTVDGHEPHGPPLRRPPREFCGPAPCGGGLRAGPRPVRLQPILGDKRSRGAGTIDVNG